MNNLTGNEVKEIRNNLDLSVKEISNLLGVNISTFYRWEKKLENNIRCDPLQFQIFLVLDERIKKHIEDNTFYVWRYKLKTTLLINGGLYSLYILLREKFRNEYL